MGVLDRLEQQSSETILHNIMTIHYYDTIITPHKHDKQSQSLADVIGLRLLKAHVRSRDCSMFCIEK